MCVFMMADHVVDRMGLRKYNELCILHEYIVNVNSWYKIIIKSNLHKIK